MGRKERKKGRPERFPSFFSIFVGRKKEELKRMAKNTAIKMTQQNNKYPSVWKRQGEEALGSERGKVKGRKEKKRKEKKRKEKKKKNGKKEKETEIWKFSSIILFFFHFFFFFILLLFSYYYFFSPFLFPACLSHFLPVVWCCG